MTPEGVTASVAAPPGVALRRPIAFDGGMLLVANAGRLVAYNATAHWIWRALAEGRCVTGTAEAMAESFAIPPDQARRDVEAIVQHWRDEALLDAPPPSFDTLTATPRLPEIGQWAARWTCRLGDRLVEILVEDAHRAFALGALLQPLHETGGTADVCLEVREGAAGAVILRASGDRLKVVSGQEGLKESVCSALVELLWPEVAVTALIHAGAVAIDDVGLCFPAPSGHGKSTLVAHLIAHGFHYLADDLTLLDQFDRVLPLPVPLSVKKGSWRLLQHLHPGLESAPMVRVKQTDARLMVPRGQYPWKPASLRALVFPRVTPDQPAELTRIRPFEALLRLNEAGLWLGHPLTDERVGRFTRWLASTPAYTLTYQGLDEATEEIRTLASRL